MERRGGGGRLGEVKDSTEDVFEFETDREVEGELPVRSNMLSMTEMGSTV